MEEEQDYSWMPDVVYKYRHYQETYVKEVSNSEVTLERETQAIKSLFRNEIFIPSIDTFNDPYDSNLPFRYHPEELNEGNIVLKSLELSKYSHPKFSDTEHHWFAWENNPFGLIHHPEDYDKFDEDTFDKNCKEFGVFCTTDLPLNYLMWSYYGDSHRGICIGYDTKKLLSTNFFLMMKKVDYSDEIPLHKLSGNAKGEHFNKIFFTKSNIWEHEEEYRFLHEYKTGKVKVIEKDVVKSVILGVKFPVEKKLDFVERLQTSFPHIEIYETYLNKESFSLQKRKIYDPSLIIGANK